MCVDQRLSLFLVGIRSCFDLTPPGIGFHGATYFQGPLRPSDALRILLLAQPLRLCGAHFKFFASGILQRNKSPAPYWLYWLAERRKTRMLKF